MRIIQDSEDEDDLELEDVAPAAPNGRNAPSKHVDLSPQAPESGTGSTGEPSSSNSYSRAQLTEPTSDSLKRTIEAAHRAHLQSPSGASSDHSRHHSSALVSGHDSKRRKTSSDAIAVKSPAMDSSRKKMPVTYGKSKTHSNSPILEQRPDGSKSRQKVTTVEKVWDLQGTMREEWYVILRWGLADLSCPECPKLAPPHLETIGVQFSRSASLTCAFAFRQHHEPMGLFSEPSSTVPNTTATQLQLLEEVMAPAFLGIETESDARPYEPAKSSVPWSEYLKSSARNTQDQSDPANQVDPPFDQHQSSQPQSGSSELMLEPTPPLAQTLPLSKREGRGSVLLKGSPLHSEVLENNVQPKESMGPPLVANQATDIEVSQDGSPVLTRATRRSSNSQPIPDELRLPSPQPRKIHQEANILSPTINAKQKSSSVPNSEVDLLAIGIPKEEYKPRPSRSRSLKVTAAESIDYSVRPEKAARKPRRSRTTGEGHASSASTPEKVQQICNMGFTPSTTQKALKENNGDVTSTVDWLVANDVAEDELAPMRLSELKPKKSKSKKDATRKLTTPTNDTSTSETQDRGGSFGTSAGDDAGPGKGDEEIPTEAPEDKPAVVPAKSPRVTVVIPKPRYQNTPQRTDVSDTIAVSSPKHELVDGTSRKAKRRKTTLDLPEPSLEGIDADPIETPKEKRRGRGRPRKEPKSTESVSEEQHDDLQANTTIGTSSVQQELPQQPNILTANTSVDVDTARASTPTPSHSLSAPTSTPPLLNTAALASKAPSKTPEKASKAAAANTLPLNKVKTPYRVGLSKRARIAPLLRTLKK